MAGELMERGAGCVAFGYQDSVFRLADGVVKAGYGCASLEPLATIRHDELQAVHGPGGIPDRDQKRVPQLSDAMGLDRLCKKVGMLFISVPAFLPEIRRFLPALLPDLPLQYGGLFLRLFHPDQEGDLRFRIPAGSGLPGPGETGEYAACAVIEEFAPAGLIVFPDTGGKPDHFARHDIGKARGAACCFPDCVEKILNTHRPLYVGCPSISARISEIFQAVIFGPSFTGCGYRPDLTPAHQVLLETGMIGGLALGLPMMWGSRTKPVSGKVGLATMISIRTASMVSLLD